MEPLDLLHLVVAAHEDARLVVDVLGLHVQHPPHVAVDRLAAGCGDLDVSCRPAE